MIAHPPARSRRPLGLLLGAVLTLPLASLAADKIVFEQQVKPILESTCVSCHGAEKPKGGLRLLTREQAIKGGDGGTSLVPGKPAESPLYSSTILPESDDRVMPPKGGLLTKAQTEVLRLWIEQGAEWPASVALKQVRRIDFVKDVQPILEFNCVACHREGEVKGGLRLDTLETALKGGDDGAGIVPGASGKSPVYTTTILPADHDDVMPPAKKGGPMPAEKTDVLRDWIDQGAPWPDGLVLKPKKAELVSTNNELTVVEDIRKLILSKQTPVAPAEMKAYTNLIPGTQVAFTMLPIPGGEFLMGSPEGEAGRNADEGPQRKVKIAPFWMGRCEVTWDEYELFMYQDQEKAVTTDATYITKTSDAVSRPTKPYVEMSFGMGKSGYPAISMTQHSANKYCEWLSAKTGQYYRLPTEAEWEYAARAGTTTRYFFGDDPAALGDYAWTDANSNQKYQKVGRKKPNPWGLLDIYGNVTEWCVDQYVPEAYAQLASVTEFPWMKSTTPYPHVARGGHWADDEVANLRSAARNKSDPSWKQQDPQLPKSIWFLTDAQWLGFRVVRPLEVPPAETMLQLWNNGVERE